MKKSAINLSIGDRLSPLEADLENEVLGEHALVGEDVQVSRVAAGSLLNYRGERGVVTGVIERYGEPVALRVKLKEKESVGPLKDFYIGREVLEDIQPPNATSVGLKSTLVNWKGQRTYWGSQVDGLEAFCFELASFTNRAGLIEAPGGFEVEVAGAIPPRGARVRANAFKHGNYWTLSTAVVPCESIHHPAETIHNHWDRTFRWSLMAGKMLLAQRFDINESLRNLALRAQISRKVLQPMMEQCLVGVNLAKRDLTGEREEVPVAYVGMSDVRLKPGFAGLTEPPTDRRPYTVVSISTSALAKSKKDPDYLKQVVLHECIHIIVGSEGGEPHNDEFKALAEMCGLKPEYRD